MRASLILSAAVVAGVAMGAGLNLYEGGRSEPVLPKPIVGKGPHFLVPAAPAEPTDPTGGWLVADRDDLPEAPATPSEARRVTSPDAGDGGVFYPGCNAVRAAGKAPLHRGEPGYRAGMDGDGDGIACEPIR